MQEIKFSHEQIRRILSQIAIEKDGYNQILKLAMEPLMQEEPIDLHCQVIVVM